jgi:hypothetical protein
MNAEHAWPKRGVTLTSLREPLSPARTTAARSKSVLSLAPHGVSLGNGNDASLPESKQQSQLLLASLLEDFCAVIEKDPQRNRRLYFGRTSCSWPMRHGFWLLDRTSNLTR